MTPNPASLQRSLEQAIASSVERFRADHLDEHLYGFALIFSTATPQIQAAFATEERLSTYTKRYCLSRDQTLTPELLAIKRTDLRWVSLDRGWLIVDLTDLMDVDPEYSVPELGPDRALESLCMEALRALDQQGLFGQGEIRQQITLGVTEDQDPQRFLQQARHLNPVEVVNQLPPS